MMINQEIVTKTFQCRSGTIGCYYDLDDVKTIQEILQKNHNVFLSESEVIDFWCWRSQYYDGSWLALRGENKEILEWFNKFIKFVGIEIELRAASVNE